MKEIVKLVLDENGKIINNEELRTENMDELLENNENLEEIDEESIDKKTDKKNNKKNRKIKVMAVSGVLLATISFYSYLKNNIKVHFSNTTAVSELIKYDSIGIVKETEFFLNKIENCIEILDLADNLITNNTGNRSFTKEEISYDENGNCINFDNEVYNNLVDAYNVYKSDTTTTDQKIKASIYIVNKRDIVDNWLKNSAVLFKDYTTKVCAIKTINALGIDSFEQISMGQSNSQLEFYKINENGEIDYVLPAVGTVFENNTDELIEMMNIDDTTMDKETINEYCRILRRILCSDDFKYVENGCAIKIPFRINKVATKENTEDISSSESSLNNNSKIRRRTL